MTELGQGLFEYHQRGKQRVNHYAPSPTAGPDGTGSIVGLPLVSPVAFLEVTP